jgi:hypothetical protein
VKSVVVYLNIRYGTICNGNKMSTTNWESSSDMDMLLAKFGSANSAGPKSQQITVRLTSSYLLFIVSVCVINTSVHIWHDHSRLWQVMGGCPFGHQRGTGNPTLDWLPV